MSETTELPEILPCRCGSVHHCSVVATNAAAAPFGFSPYKVKCHLCRRESPILGTVADAIACWNAGFLELIASRPALVVRYRSWRGEVAIRRLVPLRTEHRAEPPWHPSPCWIMDAWDCGKQAVRSFVMTGILEVLDESWQKEVRDA